MVVFRIVLVLLVFTLLLLVGLPNAQRTADVDLFGAKLFDIPVVFVMLYSFAFGAVCVGVFTLVSEIRLRLRIRHQKREIAALTEELSSFRNAPLDDGRPGPANRQEQES